MANQRLAFKPNFIGRKSTDRQNATALKLPRSRMHGSSFAGGWKAQHLTAATAGGFKGRALAGPLAKIEWYYHVHLAIVLFLPTDLGATI